MSGMNVKIEDFPCGVRGGFEVLIIVREYVVMLGSASECLLGLEEEVG